MNKVSNNKVAIIDAGQFEKSGEKVLPRTILEQNGPAGLLSYMLTCTKNWAYGEPVLEQFTASLNNREMAYVLYTDYSWLQFSNKNGLRKEIESYVRGTLPAKQIKLFLAEQFSLTDQKRVLEDTGYLFPQSQIEGLTDYKKILANNCELKQEYEALADTVYTKVPFGFSCMEKSWLEIFIRICGLLPLTSVKEFANFALVCKHFYSASINCARDRLQEMKAILYPTISGIRWSSAVHGDVSWVKEMLLLKLSEEYQECFEKQRALNVKMRMILFQTVPEESVKTVNEEMNASILQEMDIRENPDSLKLNSKASSEIVLTYCTILYTMLSEAYESKINGFCNVCQIYKKLLTYYLKNKHRIGEVFEPKLHFDSVQAPTRQKKRLGVRRNLMSELS